MTASVVSHQTKQIDSADRWIDAMLVRKSLEEIGGRDQVTYYQLKQHYESSAPEDHWYVTDLHIQHGCQLRSSRVKEVVNAKYAELSNKGYPFTVLMAEKDFSEFIGQYMSARD